VDAASRRRSAIDTRQPPGEPRSQRERRRHERADSGSCIRRLAALFAVGFALAGSAARAGVFSHAAFDTVLARHVVRDRVDYGRLARDRGPLDRYLAAAARANPESWPRNEQIAFWVNVYNARVLEGVLRRPGLESVLDAGKIVGVPTMHFFREKRLTAGRQLSLNDIEHRILRRRFAEPRVHFVLNCASASCPVLPPHPLTSDRLDAQLERAAARFLTDRTRNRIDPERGLELSSIFSWYQSDFRRSAGSVQAFVARHWPGQLRLAAGIPIRYLPYDWSLNGSW
jgi:hypothetical protein